MRALVDARSAGLSRTTGWERYVRGLAGALDMWSPEVVTYRPTLGNSRAKLLRSDWIDLPLQSRRYDVVHTPSFPPSAALMASVSSRVIWTLFDLTWWRTPELSSVLGRWYYHPMARKAVADLAMVVIPSESVALEATCLLDLDSTRVRVIPPGFEPLPYRGAPSASYGVDRKYILTVGTVEPRKNLTRLVEGYRRSGLARSFDLVAVGRQGWGGSVPGLRVLEGLTDSELGDLYRGASAYISASTYEGFGLPTLEAAQFALPLILSDIAVYREVVGKEAVFFDPTEVDDIARALVQGVEEPRRLSESKLDEYRWDSVAAQHVSLYEEIRARS